MLRVEVAMSVIVEIRSAEGGDHAKTLVPRQFDLYRKLEMRGSL